MSSSRAQARLLLVLSVAMIAAAVFYNGRAQRRTVEVSFARTAAAQSMLTGMLDQETGLRGYLLNRREQFLAPYAAGQRLFLDATTAAQRSTGGQADETIALTHRIETAGLAWRARADADLAYARRRSRVGGVPFSHAVARKAIMDRLRGMIAELQRDVAARRAHDVDRATRLSVAIIVGLSLLFALAGWLLLGRPASRARRKEERDRRLRDRQSAFASTLAVMDSEADTHALVKRHLESVVDASTVTVLNRDASNARLEPVTAVPAGSPLAVALVDAEPRTCLAVRLGRGHDGGDAEALMRCELCGKTGAERTTCTPLVMSGEVIGSVLVAHDRPLCEDVHRAVTDTVTQTAPVLANMRTLAIAELRAATDALTGLPNRRLAQETVKRMVAQAARAGSVLSAVAIDIDHFKQVNDVYGHDAGDEVLATVGQVLATALRTSDFVARIGGEEFVALLPDTDLEGGVTAAESMRRAVSEVRIPGTDRRVTASFGAATYPVDAHDPDLLLRQADRALYAAKERGRDRVEVARSGVTA